MVADSLVSHEDNQIVLVEDDTELAQWIADYLHQHHFKVTIASRGDTAVALIKQSKPQLVLLDLNLPGLDGFQVCQQLRHFYSGPVVMLTANDAEMDEVLGLEMGADDYITKPVSPRLLLARIKAHLRRIDSEVSSQDKSRLNYGSLSIDHSAQSVVLDGQVIDLSSAEFQLLWFLASNAGTEMPRQHLIRSIRGFDYDGFDRTIDVRISRLRKKLLDNPQQPFRIKTIWGKGYLFVASAWESTSP